MKHMQKLMRYVKPYWRRAVIALVLLTALVFLDLSIPRLVQRIIDQGINAGNMQVVLQTSILMLGISIVSTAIAVGNNILSVQVGESVARDLREALFLKIQSFSFGNVDKFTTGKLMVRLSSDTTAVQRLTQINHSRLEIRMGSARNGERRAVGCAKQTRKKRAAFALRKTRVTTLPKMLQECTGTAKVYG